MVTTSDFVVLHALCVYTRWLVNKDLIVTTEACFPRTPMLLAVRQ